MKVEVSYLNIRIKELRKSVGLTQNEFGKKIGISNTAVSKLESGENNITEQIIKNILLQPWDGRYVNEDWFRHNEGNMFIDVPLGDEVASVVSNVLEDIKCENTIYTLVKEFLPKYERLDSHSKKIIEVFANDIIHGINTQEKKQ